MKTNPRRQPIRLQLEVLEERTLPQVNTWSNFAGDEQHSADTAVASQNLNIIRWQTPVDLHPVFSGNDLLIHYGSPLATLANTVIVPVKTGSSGGFEINAFNGSTGNQIWSQATDYILPPHNNIWVQSYSPALTPTGLLYYAGAGGTVYVVSNLDTTHPTTPVHLAFYGISNYTHAGFDNSVFISTPITSDSLGNIYFGFTVSGANPLNLKSGIARIDVNGNGTWIAASALTTDTTINEVVQNAAPALSSDEKTVYITVSHGDFTSGYLVALDSTTLAPLAQVLLKDPDGKTAFLPDSGTASPMVGPDGHVFIGVLENPFPYNNDRGWLLQFKGDLSQQYPTGAFGWDDTASIVPKTMVPSYHTNSPYLIFTKYNNYANVGGDGQNRVAILDPGVTSIDPITGNIVMKVVESVLGPTPNPPLPGVKEWCINSAVVDPATDSVLVNSEDGKLYRWKLGTNTLTQSITLTPGIGEAYTPTLIGTDGTVYAINDATLFAVGINDAATHTTISASPTTAIYGQAITFTATVTAGSKIPNGPVTFILDGTTELGTVTLNSSGKAVFSTGVIPLGNHAVTAVFDGGNGFSASTSSAVSVTITMADSTTTLSSSANPSVYSQPVTFTAVVAAVAPSTGIPTGTVTFMDGFTILGTATLDATGTATLTTQTLKVGSHTMTAVYGGDTNFNGSTSNSVAQSVTKDGTTASLTSSQNPSFYRQTVTFVATISANAPGAGFPSGVVIIYDGSAILARLNLNAIGKATFSTNGLTPGNHNLKVVYAGTTSWGPSTSPILVQVVKTHLTPTDASIVGSGSSTAGTSFPTGTADSNQGGSVGPSALAGSGTNSGMGSMAGIALSTPAANNGQVVTSTNSLPLAAGSSLTQPPVSVAPPVMARLDPAVVDRLFSSGTFQTEQSWDGEDWK